MQLFKAKQLPISLSLHKQPQMEAINMRRRTVSTSSSRSSITGSFVSETQELDSLYDFLAKIILLGPSGCGKSCILHRFVKGDWKVLTSQTVGVEFSSKIVKVGQGPRLKRLKLQLWDTAGQERFRSLTRGYYRGSAGVLLVYDITSRASFAALSDFLADVRALTSPSVSIVVLGNKADLLETTDPTALVPESEVADFCMDHSSGTGSINGSGGGGGGGSTNNSNGGPSSYSKNSTSSSTFLGSDISFLTTSALTGENIDESFRLLAGMILTKIEMGVIDPENMDSGVQYGDVPRWDRNSTRRGGGGSGSGNGAGAGSGSGTGKKHGRSLTTLVAGSGHLGVGGNEYQSRLQKNRIVLGASATASAGQSIALDRTKSLPHSGGSPSSSPLSSSSLLPSSSNGGYGRCC